MYNYRVAACLSSRTTNKRDGSERREMKRTYIAG